MRAGHSLKERADRLATEALRLLKKPCRIIPYSGPDYPVERAPLWVPGWQIKSGKPAADQNE